MKRIWIAIGLILLTTGLCVFEQIYIENFCDNIAAMVEDKDDEELVKYWEEKNDSIYIFASHELLDEMAQKIELLRYENDQQKKSTLNEIRAINKAFHENQRIGFSNIF